MRPDQQDVLQFHEAFGVRTPTEPTLENYPFKLRIALILEELCEFAEASGYDIILDTRKGERYDANKPTTQTETLLPNGAAPDMAEMVDALCDLNYVTNGAALHMGIDLEPFAVEVHNSNMRKLGPDGKPIRRADRKIMKPEGWTPPDIKGILERITKK